MFQTNLDSNEKQLNALSGIIRRKQAYLYTADFNDFKVPPNTQRVLTGKVDTLKASKVYTLTYSLKGTVNPQMVEPFSKNVQTTKGVVKVNVKTLTVEAPNSQGFSQATVIVQAEQNIAMLWVPIIVFTAVSGLVSHYVLDDMTELTEAAGNAAEGVTNTIEAGTGFNYSILAIIAALFIGFKVIR